MIMFACIDYKFNRTIHKENVFIKKFINIRQAFFAKRAGIVIMAYTC